MTGVSPAYFLSRSGPGFGPDDMCSGLPFIARTGYESYQAEVFLESALPLWTEDATRTLIDCAWTHGLHCSAFVAHFLGAVFSSRSNLSQGLPLYLAKAAVAIASSMLDKPGTNMADSESGKVRGNSSGEVHPEGPDGRIFVVPVPAYAWPEASEASEASGSPEAGQWHKTESGSRFRDIIKTLLTLCRTAGLQLALELLPGNILGGSAAFMSLVAEPGFADLGLLLDTGHFWAMGEPVQDLPRLLGRRIVATHLCDNDGNVNLSLCPGDGTIPFPATIKALRETGYTGSLDLEIVCPKAAVETEYHRAFVQFKQLTKQAATSPGQDHATGQHANQHPHKETI